MNRRKIITGNVINFFQLNKLYEICKKGSINIVKSLVVVVATFYLLNLAYGAINRFSFKKFSEDQIRAIINAQTDSNDYDFKFVQFDSNQRPSIAVLVNSDVDWDNWSSKDVRPASLAIFELAAKNPLEKILFDSDLYKLKRSYDLIPPDSKEDYELVASSLKVINLFEDKNEEIFFCLVFAHGGSGTSFDCSIFDGEQFYSPFPKSNFTYNEGEDDYYFTLDQIDSSYDVSWGSEEPIFSGIGSDNIFHFDDKNAEMTFLVMDWGEDECHSCPHLYDVYHYKLLEFDEFLWNMSRRIVFSGGFVRKTKEFERGNPFDVLVKDYLSQ